MLEIKERATACFKGNELEDVNSFLQEFQEKTGQVFDNFTQFIRYLKDNGFPEPKVVEKPVEVPVEKPIDFEFIKVEDIRTQAESYATAQDLSLESTAIDIVLHALTQGPKEIEKEVEKEVRVEKELKPGQMIVNFDPKQIEMLEAIQLNRIAESQSRGKDAPLEALELISRCLMMNKSALINWQGEFYTGFHTWEDLDEFK